MNIENLFKHFKNSYPKFKDMTLREKAKYLTNLITRVSIDNPHYKIGEFEIYNLVKEKFDNFISDLGFKCQRCKDNCCYYEPYEFLLMEVGLYEEDIKLIREHYNDTNGIMERPNKFKYDIMKQLLNEEMTYDEFSEFERILRDLVGYKGYLKLTPTNNDKVKCYYYDEKNNSCKIHKSKPLVCYTFPIRIQNNADRVGHMICEDCNYIKEKTEKYGKEKFDDKISSLYTYWEYNVAIMLFFYYKERLTIKNGIFEAKEPINKEAKQILNKFFM